VVVGSQVRLKSDGGSRRTLRIVSDGVAKDGSNASEFSPLGNAVLGLRPGDQFTIYTPRGTRPKYIIEEIAGAPGEPPNKWNPARKPATPQTGAPIAGPTEPHAPTAKQSRAAKARDRSWWQRLFG
jgi:hypothetical protein